MAIETPTARPDLIKQLEMDFGSSTAKSIWRKVMYWQLWTNRSLPIGAILGFFSSMTYANGDPLEEPNSAYWQWCDGSPITNAGSPLNGENTPDFKEKFLKGNSTIGLLGGQSTINLQHNHGGYTGYTADTNGSGGDFGSDAFQGTVHRHAIANALSTTESVIPPYHEIQYFMRVDGGANQLGPLLETNLGELIGKDWTKYAKIFSQELATAIYNNNVWLNALIPVGMVIPIMTNIPGVASPDPNIWQECDGAEITNENSPLRSFGGVQYFTPNLIDKYIRVPTSFGFAGLDGGVNAYDFTHNHGGYTNLHEHPEGMDHSNSANRAKIYHNHTMESDLGLINMEPPFFTVRFFMRIN